MKITKALMTIGMTTAMMATFTACQQAQHENPLLQESDLPFGSPDFSKIEYSDYEPAFETAMQQQRENIQKIVDFVHTHQWNPEDIRKTVEHLQWKIQMQKVIDSIKAI